MIQFSVAMKGSIVLSLVLYSLYIIATTDSFWGLTSVYIIFMMMMMMMMCFSPSMIYSFALFFHK